MWLPKFIFGTTPPNKKGNSMYYGELNTHSTEYQCGHETGSIRAYDDAIQWFEEVLSNEKKGTKHSTLEVIAMLKACKSNWLHFCETYGMGNDE